MYWLLYNDNHTLRDEKAAQYLFYSVAYAYCEANDIDINRENDPGVGELDFKLSQGFWKKVVIEVKKASNGKLVDGFKKQLPAYEDAERTPNGIYLVLKDSKATAKNIEKLEEERSLALSKGLKCPEIIYIDVTEKPSASKLK